MKTFASIHSKRLAIQLLVGVSFKSIYFFKKVTDVLVEVIDCGFMYENCWLYEILVQGFLRTREILNANLLKEY